MASLNIDVGLTCTAITAQHTHTEHQVLYVHRLMHIRITSNALRVAMGAPLRVAMGVPLQVAIPQGGLS